MTPGWKSKTKLGLLLLAVPVFAKPLLPIVETWDQADKALQTDGSSVLVPRGAVKITRQGDSYLIGGEGTASAAQLRRVMLTAAARREELDATYLQTANLPEVVKWAEDPANAGKFLVLSEERIFFESRNDGKVWMYTGSGDPVELNRATFGAEMLTRQHQGQFARCEAQVKQLVQAVQRFSELNGNKRPPNLAEATKVHPLQTVPSCPAAGKPTYQYELSPNGKLFSVYCQGAHHSEAGQPPNHPSQSSEE